METEKENVSNEDKMRELFFEEPINITDMHPELLEMKMELDYELTKIVKAFEAKHGYGVDIEVIKSDTRLLSTTLVRTKLIFW